MSQTLAEGDILQNRGTLQALGAHVVGCVFDRAGTQAAFALGDGTVRVATLADPAAGWHTVEAHDGGVLSLSADARPTGFLSSGDDSVLQRIAADFSLHTLADFGGKWAEQTATFADGKSGVIAASAGRRLHLFTAAGEKLRALDHPSTVTGIAFDGRGKRVAVSHYNGASLWFVNSTAPAPRLLEWKGSHTGVAVHPAAEAVVTAMQENALHGWRLPDGHDMRMSGYPARPEALGFTRSGKYLASAGADAVVLWPFFGGGPMGKPPLELAQIETVICTRVACHPVQEVVAAGYADGTVAIAEIASRRVIRAAPPGQGAVTALAWSGSGGWLAFGTETGLAALIDLNAPS